MDKKTRITITGAAGLVGQNLALLLSKMGYENVTGIDKNHHNLTILKQVSPGVETVHADLAESGPWEEHVNACDCLIMLHAQIGGKMSAEYDRNNLEATRRVLEAMDCGRPAGVAPFIIHASSSVVNSVAEDDYVRTKTAQEKLVLESGFPHCVLRPTLMFGWFDPKHLGWLARFMERVPVFPIPGDGKFMRQPLYNRDFCKVIEWCIRNRPDGKAYDLVGEDRVDYVDIIRLIRKTLGLRTPIVHLPYWLFASLLRVYAVFSKTPPFTADQLKALTAGDDFTGVDMRATFSIAPTPFEDALRETLTDPEYSGVVVESV